MAKVLHNSIISYTKDLAKYCGEVGVKFDADIIHELRTTFKKFRALLRWRKIDKNVYSGFKKLYEASGELRNIQVVNEMLKKEKDIPELFKRWLSTTIIHLQKQWDDQYEKEILKQLLQDVEDLKIKPGKHKKFFSKRINRILHIINTDPVSDDDIHEIRKMTKDMQYVLEWWKKKKGSTPLVMNISIKELQNIGKRIGEYNDKRMLIILSTDYIRQEKEPGLVNDINSLLNKWQKEKEWQKDKLMMKLHLFSLEFS